VSLARWIGLELAHATPEELAAASPVLTAAAEGYLWAGGAVDARLWESCRPEERAALIAAGRRVAAIKAAWVGRASQGEIATAEVLAEVDGGEEHDELQLRAGMAGLRRALEARRE
jgi:hypothetical protein